jgi:hypothetical protein
MTKPAAAPMAAPGTTNRFKVLRAVDPAVIGGARPVEVSDESKQPKQMHYPNAKGGLRLVIAEEVRELAKISAQRLLKLAKV